MVTQVTMQMRPSQLHECMKKWTQHRLASRWLQLDVNLAQLVRNADRVPSSMHGSGERFAAGGTRTLTDLEWASFMASVTSIDSSSAPFAYASSVMSVDRGSWLPLIVTQTCRTHCLWCPAMGTVPLCCACQAFNPPTDSCDHLTLCIGRSEHAENNQVWYVPAAAVCTRHTCRILHASYHASSTAHQLSSRSDSSDATQEYHIGAVVVGLLACAPFHRWKSLR